MSESIYLNPTLEIANGDVVNETRPNGDQGDPCDDRDYSTHHLFYTDVFKEPRVPAGYEKKAILSMVDEAIAAFEACDFPKYFTETEMANIARIKDAFTKNPDGTKKVGRKTANGDSWIKWVGTHPEECHGYDRHTLNRHINFWNKNGHLLNRKQYERKAQPAKKSEGNAAKENATNGEKTVLTWKFTNEGDMQIIVFVPKSKKTYWQMIPKVKEAIK